MKIDEDFIRQTLMRLASKRLFYSEADLQLALAWEIKQQIPEADISLEHSICVPGGLRLYIDIWIEYRGEIYPLELKYKTAKLRPAGDRGPDDLKNQGACDLGRYGFLKDISRIETLSSQLEAFGTGFAVMLTNDRKYYEESRRKETLDREFRIHQGCSAGPGRLEWHSDARWTACYPPIELRSRYPFEWFPYNPECGFMALICTINKT